MTTPLLYPADNKDPNKRKHHWPWIVVGVVVALFAIGMITNAAKGGSSTVAAQAAPSPRRPRR